MLITTFFQKKHSRILTKSKMRIKRLILKKTLIFLKIKHKDHFTISN